MKNSIMDSLLLGDIFSLSPKIRVSGSSMNPTLYDGEIIYLSRSSDFSLGDVVVFVYERNEYIVHRIVYKDKEKLVCKGDNSFRLEYIKHSNIIGKVEYVIRDNQNTPLKPMLDKYIDMSYRLGLLALKYNYKMKYIISSELYKQYYYEFLRGEK